MHIFKGFQKGINLGGWLSQAAHDTPDHKDVFITEKDIEIISKWGADHVRVPVDYTVIEEEDGTFIEEGFAYIDNCISWCEKYNLNMMIDLHKTYGYTFDPLEKGDKEIFFHDEALQARFYRTWKEIARRYGKYSDRVSFELLNEVISPNVRDEWNEIALHAVRGIREITKDTYIVYGGVNYNAVTSVALLADPHDEKVVFNFHCYDPLIFTHQQAYWVDNMPDDLVVNYPDTLENYKKKSVILSPEQVVVLENAEAGELGVEFFEKIFMPAVEAAKDKGVPIYCGEYGVIDRAPLEDSVNWLKDIHTAFENLGIGRSLWNYKEKDFGLSDEHYAPVRDRLVKYL